MALVGEDIGHNHTLRYFGWAPDRELNPQYEGVPDIERMGAIIDHLTPEGEECSGAIHFDTPEIRALLERTRPNAEDALWTVESWEPLTISPSVLCKSCGDHGFVRNGKWEVA